MRSYKATVQQTLDILFLQEGSEFLSSTDASSRDSADRTIIAWDFRSAAKISNQIFHVRTPASVSAAGRRGPSCPPREAVQRRDSEADWPPEISRVGGGRFGSRLPDHSDSPSVRPLPVPAQHSLPRGQGAEGSPVRVDRKVAEPSEPSGLASAAPASPRVSAPSLPAAVVGAVTWEHRQGPWSQTPGVTARDSPHVTCHMSYLLPHLLAAGRVPPIFASASPAQPLPRRHTTFSARLTSLCFRFLRSHMTAVRAAI